VLCPATAAEHTLTITNNGLQSVTVAVNGVQRTVPLSSATGATTVNLGALFDRARNRVSVWAHGSGSADVMLRD
jgi:hypothetical protein